MLDVQQRYPILDLLNLFELSGVNKKKKWSSKQQEHSDHRALNNRNFRLPWEKCYGTSQSKIKKAEPFFTTPNIERLLLDVFEHQKPL